MMERVQAPRSPSPALRSTSSTRRDASAFGACGGHFAGPRRTGAGAEQQQWP